MEMAETGVAPATRDRYAALLEVAQVIASHRTLDELLRDLAPLLHSVIRFQYMTLMLHDEKRDVMRLHGLEGEGLGTVQPGMEFSMEESASAWVWRNQQPLVVEDSETDPRFALQIRGMRKHGVRSQCGLPLTTPRRRLGAFNLGSNEPGAYSAQELEFAKRVAGQVAVAVENAMNYQEACALQDQVTRERDRLKL